ncbi:MAG TPA: hypothetical protein VF345_05850 [Chthoniobacterales bacterium]
MMRSGGHRPPLQEPRRLPQDHSLGRRRRAEMCGVRFISREILEHRAPTVMTSGGSGAMPEKIARSPISLSITKVGRWVTCKA